jgi:hypothetical protein
LSDLRVPDEYQRGLGRLHSLSETEAVELLASIKSAVSKEHSDNLSPSDVTRVEGLSAADIEEILETIVSLYGVRANADVPTEEFIDDVVGFLQSPSSEVFRLPEESAEKFRTRLKKFLNIEPLIKASKARILRYEHERTFCTARIFTDARPVFEDDSVGRPELAVIFHMLKMSYHEGGRVKDIYISLDENDLDELRKVIKRAEVKSKVLREALGAGHLKVITPS